MKKFLCVAISVLLALTLFACGKEKSAETAEEPIEGRWYFSSENITLSLNFHDGVLISKCDDFEPQTISYVINGKTTADNGNITYAVTLTEEDVSYDEEIIVSDSSLVFEGNTFRRLGDDEEPEHSLTGEQVAQIEGTDGQTDKQTGDGEKTPTDDSKPSDGNSSYDKDKTDALTGRWHHDEDGFVIDFEFYDGVITQYYNGSDDFTMLYEITNVTANDDGSKTVSINQTDETLVEQLDIIVNGDKMTYMNMDFDRVN